MRRGRGFEYRDADGHRIGDEIELSRIRGLAIPPAWTDVWIGPHPDGHLQASGEPSRAAVLAAGFRMLDTAFLRIASERYAREHGSVGLTTLRGTHVRVDGSSIALRFRAKGGIPWEAEIDDPDLAPLIERLRERGPRARLLPWWAGTTWHPAHAADINSDVRERTGRAPATEAARRRAVDEAVRAAAAALGNTPAVARSSYVDPRVFARFAQGRVILLDGRSVKAQLAELLA